MTYRSSANIFFNEYSVMDAVLSQILPTCGIPPNMYRPAAPLTDQIGSAAAVSGHLTQNAYNDDKTIFLENDT